MSYLDDEIEEVRSYISDPFFQTIDCNQGWHQLIVDCHRELSVIDPDYKLYQVKEKFGGLRYYIDSSSKDYYAMRDVIDKFERLSLQTCEYTGEPGVLAKGKGGWMKTLSKEVMSEYGYEQA